MTSSPTQPDKTQLPTTNGSSKTSPPSSVPVSQEKLRSRLVIAETDHVRSCLSLLDCVDGGAFGSYEAQRAFEHTQNAFWLCHLFGSNWFLPNETTLDTIKNVASLLSIQKQDNGIIRRALLELWLTTKKEKTNEEDRDAMIMLYVDRLSQYNADYVALVLRDFSDNALFFPAWSEIRSKLEHTIDDRTKLLHSLRRAHAKLKKASQ